MTQIIVVRIKWDYPDESFWLNPDSVALALHAYCPNTNFEVTQETLTGSEALFGFGGWLTSREEPVTLSAYHEAGIAAELIRKFCKVNNLTEPRERWSDNLIQPIEGDDK